MNQLRAPVLRRDCWPEATLQRPAPVQSTGGPEPFAALDLNLLQASETRDDQEVLRKALGPDDSWKPQMCSTHSDQTRIWKGGGSGIEINF
jgi:hypothetical protein